MWGRAGQGLHRAACPRSGFVEKKGEVPWADTGLGLPRGKGSQFGSSHFLFKRHIASPCVEGFVCFVVRSGLSCPVMPRRGWTTVDVPEGWSFKGRGGEEDGPQVVSRSSESPSATRSESSTINCSVPAHDGGPRVSRDPDQVLSEASLGGEVGSCWCSVLLHAPTTTRAQIWSDLSQNSMMPKCGLRSAARTSPAAHWANWADCLPTLQKRHFGVARLIITRLSDNAGDLHLSGANVSAESASWM